MEIKFRAWDKENHKWIDNSDIAINQEGLLFIRYEGQVEFQPMSLTKSSNFEIVFYTGLKDKNGKEIYEGDIVRHPLFKNKSKNILIEEISFVGLITLDTITKSPSVITRHNELEIIGNKFENPELLK